MHISWKLTTRPAVRHVVDVSDIFLFLFCSGEGKGESEAPGRGGGSVFIENPRRGGLPGERRGGGRGAGKGVWGFFFWGGGG